MAYGIEIRNEAGNLVIDGEFRNFLHLWTRSRSYTFDHSAEGYHAPDYSGAIWEFRFPSPVTTYFPPILAMRVTRGNLSAGSWIGGPYDWKGVNLVTSQMSGTRICSCEMRAYTSADSSQLNPTGGYGMQVFNTVGVKVFDSRIPPLTVYSRPILNYPSDPWNRVGNTILTASSGKGLDLACLGWIDGRVNGSQGTYHHEYYKGFRDSNGNVKIRKALDWTEDVVIPDPWPIAERMGTNTAGYAQGLIVTYR